MAVQMPSRLYRSRSHKMLAGVCGGLGEYFDVDPVLIRLLFVITSFISGAGILAYIVLWIVVPLEGDEAPRLDALRRDVGDLSGRVREYIDPSGRPRGTASPADPASPTDPTSPSGDARPPADPTSPREETMTAESRAAVTPDLTIPSDPSRAEARRTDTSESAGATGGGRGTSSADPFGSEPDPFGESARGGGHAGGPSPSFDPFGPASDPPGASADPLGASFPPLGVAAATPDRKRRRQHWAGALLIVLGLLILGNNLGLLWWVEPEYLLPLILVGAGAWLLFGRGRRG